MPESPTAIRRWRCAIGVVGLLVGLAMAWSFDPIQRINDASQYESTARNLRDGGQFATSCIFYGEHYRFGSVPAPQTVFPPGYPAFMAALSRLTGCSLRTAGFAINVVCFVASGWALFSLCRRIGSRADLAFVCSASWLLASTMWHAAWLNLSEPSFMLFVLLAVRLLMEPGWRPTALSGLSAAVAISTRYAGLFLVLAVGLNHALFALRRRDKEPLQQAALFGVAPAIMLAALFGRNIALAGTMRGGNDYPMTESLQRVTLRFVASVARLFGFNRSILEDSTIAILAGAATVVVLAGAVWFIRARTRAASNRSAEPATAGEWLMLTFPVTYTAILFALEYFEGAGMTDRLMAPVLPFLLAAVAAFVSRAGTPVRVTRLAATGILLVAVVSQYCVHRRLVEAAPPSHAIHRALYDSITIASDSRQTLLEFLQTRITDQAPLLCNEPQLTYGLIKRPVVGLPTGRYNTGPEWNHHRAIDEVIEPYNVQFVLLLKSPEVSIERAPLLFQQLESGEVPPQLEPVCDTRSFTLFRVNSSQRTDRPSPKRPRKT